MGGCGHWMGRVGELVACLVDARVDRRNGVSEIARHHRLCVVALKWQARNWRYSVPTRLHRAHSNGPQSLQ